MHQRKALNANTQEKEPLYHQWHDSGLLNNTANNHLEQTTDQLVM